MGDVLAVAILITALVFGGAGVAYAVGTRGRRTAIARTPMPAIDPSDKDAALAKVQQYFRLAQSSARVMESLLADDMIKVVIPETKRQQMQQLIDRFYEL